MNHKLIEILEAILRNVDALNAELMRMYRTEQFEPHPECYELIAHIRNSCSGSLYNAEMLDKLLKKYRSVSEAELFSPDQPQ